MVRLNFFSIRCRTETLRIESTSDSETVYHDDNDDDDDDDDDDKKGDKLEDEWRINGARIHFRPPFLPSFLTI